MPSSLDSPLLPVLHMKVSTAQVAGAAAVAEEVVAAERKCAARSSHQDYRHLARHHHVPCDLEPLTNLLQ
jgi:hypothetical protein